jgi:hypothetical protein
MLAKVQANKILIKEILMFGKICPYCKEKIKKDASVCRYCGKELDADHECDHNLYYPNWIIAGLTGLATGATLALIFGYWRERRRWKQEISNYSVSEPFTNEKF